MKHYTKHIIYRLTGIFLGLLALTSAYAQIQKPVPDVIIYECDVLELSVVDMPGDEYTWDFYKNPDANFALEDDRIDPAIIFRDGDYRDESTVVVHYIEPGRYYLRVLVWDEERCTNNIMLFKVDVLPNPPTLVFESDSVCEDEVAYMKVIFTGKAPYDFVYSYTLEDQTVTVNFNGETRDRFAIPLPGLPVGTREYWVMEVTDQCTVHAYPEPYPERAKITIFRRPTSQKINVKNK